MLDAFITIIFDAMGSGSRIFNSWLQKDPKLLRKTDPDIYNALQDLTDREKKLINLLLPFFIKTSFFYLFKRLEEGDAKFVFELTIRNKETGEIYSLINDKDDLEIRNKIDSV